MEIKMAKVSVNHPGGSASKNALKYRIQLPAAWMRALGISAEQKDIELCFDGEQIIIKRR